MRLVVDASVALKWALAEDGSAEATALIARDELLAPDLLLIECANVLTMRVRRRFMTADDASDALQTILATPKRLHASVALIERAHELAVEMEQTAYDCLYLALAISERVQLITDDRRFVDTVERRPAYAGFIRRL